MYKVQFTLRNSSNQITIYFSTNLTVLSHVKSELTGDVEIRVSDGHTNWYVEESYEQVIAKIDAAIAPTERKLC